MMKCFVMMPFGRTPEEKKEYSRIYKFLIKSTVEECGLSCVRSDIEAKGGHIMGNVLDDIACDDIAIADLSGLNWNVAYELGIRHVMSKSGTILICNDETELPFDIQSLNIFIYPQNWMDDLEQHCEKLKKIIDSRVANRTHSDSPVHEKYPFFPDKLAQGLATTSDEALEKAHARIAELESELTGVYEKIDAMGLNLDSSSKSVAINYTEKFLSELENSIYYSDNAVAKLRELLETGNREEFVRFLAKVLEVGFLDEYDCRSVYHLCNRLDVSSITRTYLEAVVEFYPENEELAGFLANAYSINYHTGDKAVQIANAIIGVIKKDGNYQLMNSVQVTTTKLASFFDVYLHLKKHNEILAVGKLLCEKYSGKKKILGMTLRNMTIAAIRSDNMEMAAEYLENLLEVAPDKPLTYYACAKYAVAIEDYVNAIASYETCIQLDPSDSDYYHYMAGLICDCSYARDSSAGEIIKITDADVAKYAVPFIIKSLTLAPNNGNIMLDFLRKNNLSSYIEMIVKVFREGNRYEDYVRALPDLDFGAVGYSA